MSEKKTKSYTAEFKESAVKLAVESDQPVSATAKDLGVNINTLHTWIKLHRLKGAGKTTGKQEHKHNDERIHDELKRLRKENAKLKEERAILRKVAAFFAKECHEIPVHQ